MTEAKITMRWLVNMISVAAGGLSSATLTRLQGSTSLRSPARHCQGTPAPVLLHTVSCP